MYEEKIAVVDGLRRAYEKFKHFKEFTKRCQTFFEKELPGYTVSVSSNNAWNKQYKEYEVRVWGKEIPHSDCVSLRWSDMVNSQLQSWQVGLEYEFDRADPRDYEERYRQEQHLFPELLRLDAEVRDRIRAARVLIESLPIPVSAKLRAEQHFWNRASYTTQKQFPLLFTTDIDE